MTTIFNSAGVIMLLLILIESMVGLKEKKEHYHFKDTLASLIIGGTFILINPFCRGLSYYLLLQSEHYSLWKIEENWWSFLLLFLLADLVHYVFHFLEHKSRLLWAIHSMHHTSGYYNLSTALRTPFTSNLYRLFYMAPLCIAGFSSHSVIIVDIIILLFGALVHTDMIKKLGCAEWIINTPSHHRVHHGKEEKYVDKNFGTVLIVWDRLFGTFKPEDEHPSFGLAHKQVSNNPAEIVFGEFKSLARDIRNCSGAGEAFKLMFKAPGWKQHASEEKMKIKESNCQLKSTRK